MGFEIVPATRPDQIEIIRTLFTEYAQSLGFSLCFQGFDQELAELPGAYVPPKGRLLLASIGKDPAGCVAIRPLSSDASELKRLYVRPAFQGSGLGKALMDRILKEAREAGYRWIRLDTIVGKMDRAIAMYRRYGFKEIASYGDHPVEGTIDMELEI